MHTPQLRGRHTFIDHRSPHKLRRHTDDVCFLKLLDCLAFHKAAAAREAQPEARVLLRQHPVCSYRVRPRTFDDGAHSEPFSPAHRVQPKMIEHMENIAAAYMPRSKSIKQVI